MVKTARTFRFGKASGILFLAPLLIAVDSDAHDYWLAQDLVALEIGDTCSIRLLVGDRLDPELERPLQKEITTRYQWLTGDASLDLLSAMPDSAQPVFQRLIEREGSSLLVMDRDFVVIESTYGQFRNFLDHEENALIAEQIKDTPGDVKMRRRYARNLKSLMRAGTGDNEGLYGRRVGQTLEILLLRDPSMIELGDECGVQVLFAGEPLSNELVRAFVGTEGGVTVEMKARSDAQGIVSFKVEQKGLWVIRVAYIRPSEEHGEADWDTHYATFSFMNP